MTQLPVSEALSPPVLINGVFKDALDVFDRGFMYGDGLFETIRVVNGEPLLWVYHCKRLTDGCKKLKIPTDTELTQRLKSGLDSVVKKAGKANEICVVKIIVSRGAGGRGYQLPAQTSPSEVIICYPLPEYPSDYASEGVNLMTCHHRLSENPALAGIKHLNRLDQVLASAELDSSVSEGVMLDQKGRVIEGTKSNIIFFESQGIVSPNTKLCGVDGVARQFIFDNVKKLGLSARIDTVTPSTIAEFCGMAIINSILGVWPVRRLDGNELPISPLVYKIQHLLNDQLKYEYKV
ncbi:aminodeoxychorismate lyase [Alkalimarinus alittae]|uniref:Aminodeoxychorismate lyase n=1 Tax=Alkalimarinus alittae TaxID=2961619 RepID=A0ABY6MXX6_9ALTE|nr:aminodeoxychorismate lyase [Alkalimarinus alittae]UZE94693.1 aminodeoxychorismate lyase [Alkalimarinus alittae]